MRNLIGTSVCLGFQKLSLTLLTALGLLMVPKSGFAAGTWTPLAHQAPGGVGLMLLLSDGTVMCQSGVTWYRLTPDIYGSYVNGTWTTLAPMHDSRTYYSSQVLRDGRVWVCGGEYGTGKDKAEIYNALSNTWTQAAAPPDTVIDNISAMLPNGIVLEGFPGSDCRTYNPNADSWSAKINIFDGQDEAEWVKLQDGSIITIDPFGTNTERFIPALNQWVQDNPVPVTMYGYGGELGPGFLLPNGKVIFIGGTSHTSIYTPWATNAAGIYTPASATNAGVWTQGPDIPNSSAGVDAPAALMNNGKILCCMTDTNNSYGSGSYYYEYDYVANSFTQINAPGGGLHSGTIAYGQQMLDLPDGTVLVSGFGSQVYSYKPSGSQITNGVPAILSVTSNLDGSFHVTGTLFNGISDGAAYGDDKQMSTAYPIARMTNSSGNVLYCRTYNWSTNVVMTGTNIVSTEMTLPAGLLAGTYPLFVTANGFSSAPYQLSISGTPLPPVTGLAFTTIGSNQMAFHWNRIGLTETGYVIQRSTDGTNYSTLAVLGATTNYTDATVTPLGQYYYQVFGTNSVGLGLPAPVILAASPAVTPLPAPWQAKDVGAVLGAGASGTNAGAFTVIGSGNGISADNDQFQFVYQPIIGDVIITARVVSNQNTGSNAMAGLMIRSSLGIDVADSLLVFDGGAQSSIFEHRATAAALATYGLKVYGDSYKNDASPIPAPPGGPSGSPTLVSQPASAPLWVRLVRTGNTITSYTSTNGADWAAQGTNMVVMPPVVEVGLAVTSGAYNHLNTSIFDNVTVSGTPASVPPPVAEWKLDETSGTIAKDSIDSFDGLYNNVTLGLPGATPATGYSAGFDGSSSYISVPALNLNSNVMTVTGWVNRNGNQSAWSGVFFNRANSTVSGLHFGTANELRYTWNNSSSTYNWNSGLVPPDGVWTFVALVIEPTRARIFMGTNGVLVSATNNVANSVQAFDGASNIGQDPLGGRFIKGQLDEVQFYNQALTPTQLGQMASQPVVAVTSPTNGSALQANTGFNLTVSLAATNSHVLTAVEYFADDGELLGQSATPPFSSLATGLSPGTYSLFARLYYGSGYSVDSALNAVQITVQPSVTNIWDASGSLAGPQDGSGDWGGGAANWWNGSAAVSWVDFNYAVFGSGTTTNCTVTLTNDVAPYAITFDAGAGSYTLAGTNNIWLSVPRTPFNVTVNGNATISAPLQGVNSLVKSGNGTLTLTASNNYAGSTVVTAGVLKIGNNLALSSDVVVSNTGSVNLNGLDFTASMFGVPFTLGGTGLSVLTNSSSTRALVQDVELASDCTIASANTIFIGGTNAVNGVLNLNGHTLTKAGSGTVILNGLILSGAGNITVNAGTLQLMDTYGNNQQNTALSGSGNLTINAGGSVITPKWGPTLTLTMPVVMNGGTLGSTWPGSDGATLRCPVLVNTNSTFNFNGGGYGNVTFSGNITGAAGLTITGDSQTRTFTGTNSYGWTTISAGILKIGNAGTSGTLGVGPVTNNANLTFSRSDTLLVTNPIAGTGVLNQSGVGTLVLAGRNLYTGITTVNSGTLLVNGSTSTNTLIVMTNATLGGAGTINGSVVITNMATFAPGTNNPGVLVIYGKLALASNSTNRFRLNKGGVSDEVSGSSGVIYGGTLLVTNAGPALAAGDSFRLFGAAGYSGTFSTIQLPSLATNLVWDTSKLSVNGALSVAAPVVITNQPQSIIADAGQNVSFSVGVSGSGPLSYQWYFNGINLSGATQATLMLTNAQMSNAGNYLVVITNSISSTTSSVVTLAVNVPPVFSSQPHMVGGSVQFSFSGQNGQTYRVLGSTNLDLPMINWLQLTSGTFGAGPVLFTDPSPTNAEYFYRIASP